MDANDFDKMNTDEMLRTLLQHLAGSTGLGASSTRTTRSGQPRDYRRQSFSPDVDSIRKIYQNLGVRAPTKQQLERGAIRRGLNSVQSTAGIEDVLGYSAQGNSPAERFRDTIRYMREVAEGEPARLRQESSPGLGLRDFESLGEISGMDHIKTQMSDVIQSISPSAMGREDKQARIKEVRGIKNYVALQSLFADFDEAAKGLGGGVTGVVEAARMFTGGEISKYNKPVSKAIAPRGVFAQLDDTTLNRLSQSNVVGAARELLSRNLSGRPDQGYFVGIAKRIRTVAAVGALDAMIANGATSESFANDPKAHEFIRKVDQIEQRQQSSSLVEQFASYFNYMTTQGMRRGAFRFVAQEVAPAVRASMLSGATLGGALVGNFPLLAAAGVGLVAASALEVNKLSAEANLARLSGGTGAHGFNTGQFFGSSFSVGQSPETFIRSMRMLALTQSPGMNTLERAKLSGQITNATGMPTQNVNEVLNRMASLGMSQQEQRTFSTYMMAGVNGNTPAQSQYLLDFYTKLGVRPDQGQFQQASGVLNSNPLLGSFLPGIGNAMSNPQSAFTIAMLTGRKPSDLYSNPLAMGKSLLGLFGKGGMFNLGPDLTPLIAAQFGLSPQDILRLQSSEGGDLINSLGSLPAVNVPAGNIGAAAGAASAANSGAPALQRILGLSSLGDPKDYLSRYGRGAVIGAYDPVTNRSLGNEAFGGEAKTVQAVSAALLQSGGDAAKLKASLGSIGPDDIQGIAGGLGLNSQDQQTMIMLLQQIVDIESGKQSGVKLAIDQQRDTTQRQVVNSPTPNGNGR